MPYFEYGEKETGHLKRRDDKLGVVIDRLGVINAKLFRTFSQG